MGTYKGFNASVQGQSHIKTGKVCQDASESRFEDDYAIITIADGHGSDNCLRSESGSKFAVEAALEQTRKLVEALENHPDIDIEADHEEILQQLAKSILNEWHNSVDKDVGNKPFQESEMERVSEKYRRRYLSGNYNANAYGTTLILACLLKNCWFGIQIGDGKCVTISHKGALSEPIPWDDACEHNVTTSICDSNAIEKFRYFYSQELPAAVFMGTDGVDDSYPLASDYQEFYRAVFLIAAKDGIQTAKDRVNDYLPELTRTGSGDDISVACAIDQRYNADNILLISKYGEEYTLRQQYENAITDRNIAEDRMKYFEDALEKNRAEYEKLMLRIEKQRQKAEASRELELKAEKKLAVLTREIAELEAATYEKAAAEPLTETEAAVEVPETGAAEMSAASDEAASDAAAAVDAIEVDEAAVDEAAAAGATAVDEVTVADATAVDEAAAVNETAENADEYADVVIVDSADTWNAADCTAAAEAEEPAEDIS